MLNSPDVRAAAIKHASAQVRTGSAFVRRAPATGLVKGEVPMSYARATYSLRHYEIVAPAVLNNGEPSGYPDALADALDVAGYGWTAHDTLGSWQGTREPGRTFTVYASDGIGTDLARIGRCVMPDQDAVQVVTFPDYVTLTEA